MVFPVADEEPGHPRAHHHRARILASALHVSHRAPVAVCRADGQPGLLLKAQPRQVLPAALTVGLSLLGRVDAGQADFDLLVRMRCILCRAAGREGVAVADADDQAEEGGREHGAKYALPRQRGAEAPLDFREESLSSPFFLAGQRFRGPDSQPLSGTSRFYERWSALASAALTSMRSGVAILMLIGAAAARLDALLTGRERRSVDTV